MTTAGPTSAQEEEKRGLLPSCNCCVDVRSSSHDRAVLIFPGSVIRDSFTPPFVSDIAFVPKF
jgi:hypothetical protein